MDVCEIADKLVALGSLGRSEVWGKQAAIETKTRENAAVAAVWYRQIATNFQSNQNSKEVLRSNKIG